MYIYLLDVDLKLFQLNMETVNKVGDNKLTFFKRTKPESPIAKVALALAAWKDGQWHFSGTAVLIGQGFAITATHVIDDFISTLLPLETQEESQENDRRNRLDYALGPQKISIKSTEYNCRDRHITIYAFQFGFLNNLWTVKRAYGSPCTDITFLKLVPANEGASTYKAPSLVMNLIVPRLGERVSGFGYHNQKSADDKDTLICDSSSTIGKVISIHNDGLPGKARIPCFLVDARIDGGMSGCPFFNEQGELCGIASMSYDSNKEGEYTSRIACLWPSMNTLVDLSLLCCHSEKPYPVLELAKLKYLHVRNWERVAIEEDGISFQDY